MTDSFRKEKCTWNSFVNFCSCIIGIALCFCYFAAHATDVPPTNVSGIIAAVKAAPVKLDALKRYQELLIAQEPDISNRFDLVKFLNLRAQYANEFGATKQRLIDQRRLMDLTKGSYFEELLLYSWARSELQEGDLWEGVDGLNLAIKSSMFSAKRTLVEPSSRLVLGSFYAETGQVDLADKEAREVRFFFNRFSMNPGQGRIFVDSIGAGLFALEGSVLSERGKWIEAESKYQIAMQYSNKTVEPWALEERLRADSNNPFTTSQLLDSRTFLISKYAEHLIRLGKVDEAEILARSALNLNLKETGRISTRTVVLLALLADIMTARGRFSEAVLLVTEADGIAQSMGADKFNWLSVTTGRAFLDAQIGLENWDAAAAAGDALLKNQKSGAIDISVILPNGFFISLIQTGRAEEAYVKLQKKLDQFSVSLGKESYQTAETMGVVAIAEWTQGHHESALKIFASATDTLIKVAAQEGDMQSRGVRAVIRRQIFEAYLQALADSPNIANGPAMAFRIADVMNLGKTQQAVTQSAARAAANQPGIAALIRQEQDQRAELVTLYGQLLRLASFPPDKQLPKVMADIRKRIEVLTGDVGKMKDAIERRFPQYANLVYPRIPTLDETQAVLTPDEALILLLTTRERTYVWAFRAKSDISFSSVKMGQKEVDVIVARLRQALDPGEVDLSKSVPVFDLQLAYGLYKQLLAPVSPGWSGAKSLLISANGALGQIPFALLPTEKVDPNVVNAVGYQGYQKVPWLIRKAAVAHLPSMNTLVTLRKLPAAPANRLAFAGFGDPQFLAHPTIPEAVGLRNINFARPETFRVLPQGSTVQLAEIPALVMNYGMLPALPDTRDEILSIARALNADSVRDVFLGKEASRSNVMKTDLSNRRIVAFATHGLLANDFPGVDQPSLALSNPGNGQNGLLTLDDILSIKLNADWVILSACNTAAGEGRGADAVSGLGRGFFYAGTRSLLVTHWPVETVSARMLVTGIFERQQAQPELSRSEALRQSILAVMQTKAPQGNFTFGHPIFWAPYVLVGDGAAR